MKFLCDSQKISSNNLIEILEREFPKHDFFSMNENDKTFEISTDGDVETFYWSTLMETINPYLYDEEEEEEEEETSEKRAISLTSYDFKAIVTMMDIVNKSSLKEVFSKEEIQNARLFLLKLHRNCSII